jgi:hypothetical protein
MCYIDISYVLQMYMRYRTDKTHISRKIARLSLKEHNISGLLNALDLPALEAAAFDGCVCPSFYETFSDFLTKVTKTLRLLALGQVGVVDLTFLGSLTPLRAHTRVSLCSSSFCGHVAQRVGRAHRTDMGIRYEDRWSRKGAPGHLLSLAYTSKEMWSTIPEGEDSFTFTAPTFRGMGEWLPASPGLSTAESGDSDNSGSEEDLPSSVLVSICKGASKDHRCFSESWVS